MQARAPVAIIVRVFSMIVTVAGKHYEIGGVAYGEVPALTRVVTRRRQFPAAFGPLRELIVL